MTGEPTRGATELVGQAWQSRRVLAVLVRILAFVLPLAVSVGVLRGVGSLLYRPIGQTGLVIWIIQAAPIGATVSVLVDRVTRRLLPLATLLGLSMVFPDQAPSRFSMALRSGSVRQLNKRLEELETKGLGTTVNEAAAHALELVASLSTHDRLTRGHSERVRAHADLIAQEMGLPEHDRLLLAWGVLLHDMGKLAVPAEVLNKKGDLTGEEWELLKEHPAAGVSILEPLSAWLGEWVLAASEHHERWDGTGYPQGLAGTEISLAGRITAVADAYDVITAKRSYKDGMSVEAARQELVRCAGAQFDPDVVRAYLNVSLGKRWTFGPLAWLSDIPIGQIGTAVVQTPVIAVSSVVLAASSVIALPPAEPESLAFATSTSVPEASTTSLATQPARLESTAESTAAPLTIEPSDGLLPSDKPTTSISRFTTIEPASDSTTSTPTSTAPASTSTATSSSATTTAISASTTTTTTTSTTSASTTTTSTQPAQEYFLKNPGSGNTSRQGGAWIMLTVPDDASLPNFDTNYDSVAGIGLLQTGNGWTEGNSERILIFRSVAGDHDLSGPVHLSIHAAVPSGGSSASVAFALADCNQVYASCNILGEATGTVTSTIDEGFQNLTFSLGTFNHSFGSSRRLVLLAVTTTNQLLHIGYDSDETPSSLTMTLIDT